VRRDTPDRATFRLPVLPSRCPEGPPPLSCRKEPTCRRDLRPARPSRRCDGASEPHPCDRRAHRGIGDADPAGPQHRRRDLSEPGRHRPEQLLGADRIEPVDDRPGRVADRAWLIGIGTARVARSILLDRAVGQCGAKRRAERTARGPGSNADATIGRNGIAQPRHRRSDAGSDRDTRADPDAKPDRDAARNSDAARNTPPNGATDASTHGPPHAHSDARPCQGQEAPSAVPVG
jgi:hypothetical protein